MCIRDRFCRGTLNRQTILSPYQTRFQLSHFCVRRIRNESLDGAVSSCRRCFIGLLLASGNTYGGLFRAVGGVMSSLARTLEESRTRHNACHGDCTPCITCGTVTGGRLKPTFASTKWNHTYLAAGPTQALWGKNQKQDTNL